MQKDQSPLEKEVQSLWSNELHDLPVYKDLPRLAGRITVVGDLTEHQNQHYEEEYIEQESSNDNNDNGSQSTEANTPAPLIRDYLIHIATSMGREASSVEPFIKALEADWYTKIDNSLLLITDAKWKEYGVPDRLVQELRQAAKNPPKPSTQTSKPNKVVHRSTINKRTISKFRLSDTYTQADVNNAAKAEDKIEEVTVETAEVDINHGYLFNVDDLTSRLLREISRVVQAVAKRLETPEIQAKVKTFFDETFKHEKLPSMEYACEDLFKILGPDSKTARVFKAIHQNIIFLGVYQIKTKVPMKEMTRDVRTPEGWRIEICFSRNIVSVSHRRREQSLATAPVDEQYWFEWDLRMVFDKDLKALESATVKITNLGFSDHISAKKRAELTSILASGNLIVC